MSFANLNLQAGFVKSIESAGYVSPTELQSKLIPLIGERKSALVWSQSAAGKTGAFLIPAINYILAKPLEEKRGARILILTSRRDRVSQINYTLKRLTRDHDMRFGFIVSGRPYQPQMRLMRRPLDMMVATPGRLNDLVDNNKADFSRLEMLIIDDMTTIYQKNMHGLISKIIDQVEKPCPIVAFVRQDDEVRKLAHELIPNAVEIEGIEEENEELPSEFEEINTASTPEKTTKATKKPAKKEKAFPSHTQHAYVADDYTHKIALIDHFLDEFAGEPTIIYTATNKAATTLQDNLANHGHTAELASQLSESEISTNDTPTLIVCDQKSVKLAEDADKNIIHFDLPFKLDNYRKRLNNHSEDRESAMIILADGNDYDALRRIEKAIGESIEQHTAPGLEPLNPFKSTLPANSRKQTNTRTAKASTTKKTTSGKKPASTNGKAAANKTRGKATTARKAPAKGKTSDTKKRIKPSNGRAPASADDKDQRRQRKGPYGRLNGGAQRKRTDFGVSTTGTKSNQPAPMSDSGWDKAIAENNKPTKEKRVVIRHKAKKRTILKDDTQQTDI
ncbi:DEAD/DEAH box helicase [Leucothrix sargassi]|nr:DEAD/DEAH box helicase [Leucothrix sargassi]